MSKRYQGFHTSLSQMIRQKNPIIRMILLTVMDLSGVVNISVIEIVICVIRNTIYHPPKSLVL